MHLILRGLRLNVRDTMLFANAGLVSGFELQGSIKFVARNRTVLYQRIHKGVPFESEQESEKHCCSL